MAYSPKMTNMGSRDCLIEKLFKSNIKKFVIISQRENRNLHLNEKYSNLSHRIQKTYSMKINTYLFASKISKIY